VELEWVRLARGANGRGIIRHWLLVLLGVLIALDHEVHFLVPLFVEVGADNLSRLVVAKADDFIRALLP